MILSTDIYNYSNDTILYTKGTVLTLEKIEKLKRFGNVSVQVEDKKEIVTEENNIDIIRKTVESDLARIYLYANQIISSVLDKNDIKSVLKKVDCGIYDLHIK